MASSSQHTLKLLCGAEMPQRALKTIIPQVRFFSQKATIKDDTLERSKAMQVFSRPTYDRIAKHILSNDEAVRIDILRAFTGLNSIRTATQLDEHYNPFDPFSNLRKLVNSSSSRMFVENIRNATSIKLLLEGKEDKDASGFLKGLGDFYDDLVHAFPDQRYRSTVDFLCETDFGYVTIEFQVAKQDYWDKRALAYIASIYGNQLRPGQDFEQLKPVIGVNLLGDGSTPYWKDDLASNIKLKQWIEFFKSAHEQQETPTSVAEVVKKAYSMIRVDTLKKEHPELLKSSEDFFSSLTEHNKAIEREALVKVIKKMLKKGLSIKDISSTTELSTQEVEEIQKEKD
jgi:hypothetical protein